jgi:hypothetical protein
MIKEFTLIEKLILFILLLNAGVTDLFLFHASAITGNWFEAVLTGVSVVVEISFAAYVWRIKSFNLR